MVRVALLLLPMRVGAQVLESPRSGPERTEHRIERNASTDTREPSADDTEWATGSTPMTVSLREGTSITLGPNSRVSRQTMVSVPLGIKDAASRVFSIELLAGTVEIHINGHKRPIYGVLIHAPRKVSAIVKTGRAIVGTSVTGTTVAARSGRDMSVSVSERWRPLRVGRSFSVTNTDPMGRQIALPTAPTVRIDRPVAFALGTDVPLQRLEWRPVQNARAYWVRIHCLDGATSTLVRQLRVDKPNANLEGLAPGRYRVEVTTIDEYELESPESAPVLARVLAANLPPGAYASGSTVYLPVNARISLVAAESLEMTYGRDNEMFVAAPETIGLLDGKPVRLRLRERGSAFETSLQLEPLGLEPRIVMDPNRAIWPGPPVNIVVTLRRSDGTLPANEPSITATVTVNAKPIEVKWQRSKGTLKAEVEKPPYPGPWVVRVAVQDPQGQVVAHNFLEVAATPPEAFDLSALF